MQDAEGFRGQVVEVKAVLELALGAEQEVAEHPVGALLGRPGDVGQQSVVVVDQPGADDRRRAQQAERQLLGELGVDVVGDTRGRIVADFQERVDFPVDGGIFTGIIDADLQQTERRPQDKTDQHSEPGLLVRQAVGELDVHGVLNQFPFPFAGQA